MKLRDYQIRIAQQSLSKLKELKLMYLALETRVGKTIIALEICKLFNAKKVLFVTKKKAIGSILYDYEHYRNAFECVVINYESVLKVKDKYDVVICDEAHSLGAFPKPSKRQKDVKSIAMGVPVILMSATPSPESYSQLYHQFVINGFHSWSQARNFYRWADYYVNKKIKYLYGKEINDYSDAKIDLIEKKTSDYFIKYTQKEAGFSQTINENILTCRMDTDTYRIIDKLNRDLVVKIDENTIVADTAVKLMNKIHQLSSGTVITEEGNAITIDYNKGYFIRDYFEKQKIAIFYKFKQEFELLKHIFTKWTSVPEIFQKENITFLGQFQSAREGIRLDTADALIFYNIDFSYLSYEQSKNRILSKERNIYAPMYFVFSDHGIERKIYNVVKNKQDYTTYHYRKDYAGKAIAKTDNILCGNKGLVCGENNNVQQKRLSGFDVIEKR